MNILVIGQGGREHALVRALNQAPTGALERPWATVLEQVPASGSARVKDGTKPSNLGRHQVHALPGSDGMAQDCICHAMEWENFNQVLNLIRREKIELVVIGPELPLAAGLSNFLRENQIAVFAPSREAARLESSKVFAKDFMREAGVPTARSFTVSSVAEVEAVQENFAPPYVLKADGLAAGKGVFICKTREELRAAAHSIFVERSLGEAGAMALLEEFSPGFEVSYLVLTNGETFEPLVLAQDHKRLLDGDEGPNTGGMGVVAPMPLAPDLQARVDREAIAPVIAHLKRQGLFYRGVLYFGFMMTDKGPSILEFNTRFGDPETQVIMPLLDGDWAEVFWAVAQGQVPKLKWHQGAASACVVLAAEGYPDAPKKGVEIQGHLQESADGQRYFLHAGTRHDSKRGWLTAGGRVLNSMGLGRDIREAIRNAYLQAESAQWSGRQMRRDIGSKVGI